LDITTIQNYVLTLKEFGLKAVILTGGGEPLSYSDIHLLIPWLKKQKLSVGLITNGTVPPSLTLDEEGWRALSWVHQSKISLPVDLLKRGTVVGCSMVCSQFTKLWDLLEAQKVSTRLGAKYVRLLPDCMDIGNEFEAVHGRIDRLIELIDDKTFFRQNKYHRKPNCSTCHQSYFRPYLSEQRYHGNDLPGSVYPCDSVVLNGQAERFEDKFQICHANDVAKYLNREISLPIDPSKDCTECVFTDTVEMLGDWKDHKVTKFAEFPKKLKHEEFV